MERGFRENEFNYLLFLRLLPAFPFWAVNLAPAFLGVKTRMYVVTTFLGIVPGTAVYAAIGDGLGEVLASGEEFSLSDALGPEIVRRSGRTRRARARARRGEEDRGAPKGLRRRGPATSGPAALPEIARRLPWPTNGSTSA